MDTMASEGTKSGDGYNQPPPYSEKNNDGSAGHSPYAGQQATAYGQQPGGYEQQPVGIGQPYSQQQYVAAPHGNPTHVVVATAQPQIILTNHYKSYAGQIILSCCVFWCCCWPLGLVGFILAMIASSSQDSQRPHEAERLGKFSYGFSIAGIILGVIIVVTVIAVCMNNNCYRYNSYSSNYPRNG